MNAVSRKGAKTQRILSLGIKAMSCKDSMKYKFERFRVVSGGLKYLKKVFEESNYYKRDLTGK